MTVTPTVEVLCNLCNSVFTIYEQQQLTAEQKAWDEDSGITDRERKRCDEIDEQISNLDECVEYIQFAMMRLEGYTD